MYMYVVDIYTYQFYGRYTYICMFFLYHPLLSYVSPSKRTVCHLRSLHHGLGVERHVAGISESWFLFSMWLFPEEYATAAGVFFFKGFPCTSLVAPPREIELYFTDKDNASHVALDGDPIVPQKRCGVGNIDNLGREKVGPIQPTG